MNTPQRKGVSAHHEAAVNANTTAARLRVGLVRKLRAVRGRMRIALAVEATARLLVTAILIFAIAAFLDWLVRFPVLLRTLFLCAAAAWAGVHAYRRIYRPLTSPVPLDELAQALDGLPGSTRDLWASVLRYLNHGAEGSQEMWSRLLAETDHAASTAIPARLVRMRPAFTAVLVAMLCTGVLIGVGWWAPWAVRTGADRLARPMSGAQWPKKRLIEPLTGDSVVAWGETFTAEMRLARGDDPAVRGYIIWQSGTDPGESAMMRRDPDGVYRMTLEKVHRPIRYSFRAGDDDTSNEPFLLRVVKRPEVEAVRLKMMPPSYAVHLPVTTMTLDDHDAEALVGSTAQLVVRPSKLISGAGASRAMMVFDDGQRLPLVPTDDSPLLLEAEFQINRSESFQVLLVDAQGLESRPGAAYRIRARADELPVVNITTPESVIEATPQAVIEVHGVARDDVGLAEVRLRAGRTGEEWVLLSELFTHNQDHDPSFTAASGQMADTSPSVRVEFAYKWNLSETPISVGDVLEYVAEARDVYRADGEPRDVVRSAIGRIHVISAARLMERLNLEVVAVREQLRSLIAALQDSRERTTSLDAGPSRQIPLTDLQRGEAEHLTTGLHRLQEVSAAHVRALREVTRQATRNQLAQSAVAEQADRLATRLADVAPSALQEAASQLQRSAQTDRVNTQHEYLQASAQTQSDLLQALRSMVREMEQWSEYEDFVRRLRDILDRQESLERETRRLSRIADDRALPQHEIARTTASQMQLRGETATLLAAMLEWAGQQAEADRVSAESLRDAVTVARRLTVLERMDEAVGAIQSVRFASAVDAQHATAAGLRAMITALGDRPERQLAELTRDLSDAVKRLKRLIGMQESLIEKNRRARDAAEDVEHDDELADRQLNLRTTARRVADLIKQDDEAARYAKQQIQAAADEMTAAAEWLDSGESTEAEEHQLASAAALKEALAALEDFQNRVDQEMGERALEALVEAMIEVRRKQQALRAETTDIHTRSNAGRSPVHADAHQLIQIARLQRELLDPTQRIREKVGESVVYVYLLDRILLSMEIAAGRLDIQDVAAALAEQDRIIRDLGRLIEAAQERRDDKQPRFVQDSTGGGGGAAGQPTSSRPVPTLAELKILKALQADVSEETTGLGAQLPESPLRTPRELREIESLGQRQREIRELAGRMVQRAEDGR